MIDLVCLVADKNMEAVVDAVLRRPESLGMRSITSKIVVHPHRDSGCYTEPGPFLNLYRREASHAFVLLDRAWEGAPRRSAIELEADVDGELARDGSGWAKCIVIDPELEVWLCRRTPRLEDKLGWHGRSPTLTEELERLELWPFDAPKPRDPKSTIEWALRRAQRPRSSAIYRDIASALGMKECVDPAFNRFRATLQAWFPAA